MKYTKIEDLGKDIEKLGYKSQKRLSSRRLAVLTNENRTDVLKTLAEKFKIADAKYDSTPSSLSSVGLVWIGKNKNMSIIVKPASKQGAKSAGLDNEMIVINAINNAIKENAGTPINVLWKQGNKKFLCKNIIECVEMGRDTSGRKKADIVCVSKSSIKYPISIKKDNAEYWESADKYWGPKAQKYVEKAVVAGAARLSKESGGYYKLIPNLAVKATPTEVKQVVFGSDLGAGGAVISRTFSSSDFMMDAKKNTLVITVSGIITNTSDIPKYSEVYFLIRNDKTRNNPSMPKGLRVLAAYKSRINQNVQVVK